MVRRCFVLLVLVALLAGGAAGAQAQERRWEVEVYGGLVAARSVSDGSASLPAAGAPIVTSNPLYPSREVPSWFFGDGAALLNAVNEEGTSRVAPLDPLFARVEGGRTGAAGVRLRRSLSPKTSLEFAVDFLGRAPAAPADLDTAVESARRSFADTFTELLRSGPFTSTVVEATADVAAAGRRRDIAATAGFSSDLGTAGALTPYVTLAGGIVTGTGPLPSAELSGRYRFSILGQVPIDETDRVTIDFDRPLTFTAVVGGGVRHAVSDRWALRFDVRAFVGPDASRVRLTAAPSSQPGSPADFVQSTTNPSIQFSNNPSIGRRSTLSAEALEGVTVFEGGVHTRTVITVGLSRRF